MLGLIHQLAVIAIQSATDFRERIRRPKPPQPVLGA